jgi:hypothetical protein
MDAFRERISAVARASVNRTSTWYSLMLRSRGKVAYEQRTTNSFLQQEQGDAGEGGLRPADGGPQGHENDHTHPVIGSRMNLWFR